MPSVSPVGVKMSATQKLCEQQKEDLEPLRAQLQNEVAELQDALRVGNASITQLQASLTKPFAFLHKKKTKAYIRDMEVVLKEAQDGISRKQHVLQEINERLELAENLAQKSAELSQQQQP